MTTPQILFKGRVAPENIKQLIIPSQRVTKEDIESKIDEMWAKIENGAKQKGCVAYNGLSYRFEGFSYEDEVLTIKLSTLEYKVKVGIRDYPNYYDLSFEHFQRGSFVSTFLVTSDNKFVMARLTNRSMNHNKIDSIGGVNEIKEVDEMVSIKDLLTEEIREEALVSEDELLSMDFLGIYMTGLTNIGFHFITRCSISSSELVSRSNANNDFEIEGIEVFDESELREFLSIHSPTKKLLLEFLDLAKSEKLFT